MDATDLRAAVRARPFRPFRIVLLDATTCEVRHPDLVIVATGAAHIGYPAPDREGVAQRVDIIGLQAISRIEFIEQPSAAVQGNGNP